MKPLVETRKTKNGTEYLCPIDGWVSPTAWDGTGYTKYVCSGCGATLDDDPTGSLEYEINGTPDEDEDGDEE